MRLAQKNNFRLQRAAPVPSHACSVRIAILAAGALLLTSCLPRQQDEVAMYRSLLDERVKPATVPGEQETLTLVTAMALANGRDETLASRGEDYVQALIQKHRVVESFLPTVTLQPTFTIEDRPSGQASILPTQTNAGAAVVSPGSVTTASSVNSGFRTVGNTFQRTEVPVVGGFNLFRGFADIESFRVLNATVEQRKQLLFDLQSTVLINVAQTYYQVLRSEKQVSVLRDSLAVQNEQLREVTDRFQQGLGIQLDVAQSEALRDGTSVQLTQAESDVHNGRSTLAYLIGVPAVPNVLVDDYRIPAPLDSEDQFETRARAARQDLLAARAQVEAAKHSVEIAFAEYYPSVSINVAGFAYREFYSEASQWNAILSASIPIFSAGQIEADVRTAWSRLRQALLVHSQVERNALKEVQISYNQFTTSDIKVQEIQSQVQASQIAYDQARSAFKNGLSINLDVLTAQQQLLNSQLLLASAGFDKTVFYLSLLRAAGEIVQ